MNYSFEYIDIILLAMIAGFIFLRLRGILGKRTGFEGKSSQQFQEILKEVHPESKFEKKETKKKSITSVLDIGCGPGHFVVKFLEQEKKITNIQKF